MRVITNARLLQPVLRKLFLEVNVFIALNLSCGFVVPWKLLLEVNVSVALNLSCGIVVLWKLLLEVNVFMALNLSCGIVVPWKPLLFEVEVSTALNLSIMSLSGLSAE